MAAVVLFATIHVNSFVCHAMCPASLRSRLCMRDHLKPCRRPADDILPARGR
jgi:hypothetical protein